MTFVKMIVILKVVDDDYNREIFTVNFAIESYGTQAPKRLMFLGSCARSLHFMCVQVACMFIILLTETDDY